MQNSAQQPLSFKGFVSPRYTQVPDELFDELMAHLSGSELKVLLYIIRRTFGFKKDVDNISLNQICKGITTREGVIIDRGTGLSQNAVLTALKGLIDKKAISSQKNVSKEKGNEPTTYSLNIIPFRNNFTPPSSKIEEALPQKLRTQNTVIQNTDIQEIKINVNENLEKKDKKKRGGVEVINDIMKRFDPVKKTAGKKIQPPKKRSKKLTFDERAKRDYLAQEMADSLNDQKSLGAFRTIAETVPEIVIRDNLASVKETWKDGKIKQSRGALFISMIQQHCEKKQIQLFKN